MSPRAELTLGRLALVLPSLFAASNKKLRAHQHNVSSNWRAATKELGVYLRGATICMVRA